MIKQNNRVAVFIDAENISNKYAEKIIKEASDYGEVIVKRIYADWSHNTMQSWKENISKFSMIPEQQFNLISGKNTSDLCLVIDSLIVLFEKNIDVFCIASSDSDFTRLVQELRERNKLVVGFGEKKTNQAFINAFSEFVYLDEKLEKEKLEEKLQKTSIVTKKQQNKSSQIDLEKEKLEALTDIIDKLIEEHGKALYSQITINMKNKYSDFLPNNYGYKTIKKFFEALIREELTNYKIKQEGTIMYLI
jgi:uncharacterized LabA/DUF88 family protein